MSSPQSSPLQLHHVTLTWPDGTPCLSDLDLLVPTGRSGLVGANGSGKSTILRLLAGAIAPDAGTVAAPASIGYLPQDLTLDVDQRADAFLGVAERREALRRVEAGSTDQRDYDLVGDDWDLDERTVATLTRVGLPATVLERRLGELSGGEVTQLGLTRLLLERPDVLLLDEPTNNLDHVARDRLAAVLASWRGTLLVVSHDPALLEQVDRIGDLREGRVRWYGGGWTAYREQIAAEQNAAEQAVTTAKADVRKQRHDLVESERVLAKRRAYGQKMWDNKREPKIVMGARKREAQVSAAAYTRTHQQRLEQARGRLEDAESRLREDREIRVDLPGTEVPPGRVVATSHDLVIRTGTAVPVELRGPERVALVGRNGSGKTTLLRTLAGQVSPRSGSVEVPVPLGFLPQRLDLLDDDLSVVANVRARAPEADDNAVRARLARFLFRGRAGDQRAGTLSGGERFRATLACLLLAEPPPQLLLLDEPTNNLDLSSRTALVTALEGYGGPLLVASHDPAFLDEIGIERTISLD